MISVYRSGDDFVWVPVAKENIGKAARAFLPSSGLLEEYTHGYKGRPERDTYLKALAEIQEAAINNISEIFSVESGAKQERQYKAKWRYGRHEDAPLLGPTKGWVHVPVARIAECTEEELARALDHSGSTYASLTLAQPEIDPVLCEDENELLNQSNLLRKTISHRIPIGQLAPLKKVGARDSFVRDAAVVAYVLNQACGICECCAMPGPFQKDDGEPYLEVHHVKHLASKGSDKIENAIAVCPNCHRELHFGANRVGLVENLFVSIKRLVRE